jgi:NTE family protein
MDRLHPQVTAETVAPTRSGWSDRSPGGGAATTDGTTRPVRALVLSGGIALGAFEAGAYAALEAAGEPPPDWLVGASIGAVNAAIIAGNPPARRIERLRRFWDSVAVEPMPATAFLLGPPPAAGPWRRAYNQASALQTLLFGRPGLFRPRLLPGPEIGEAPALYDLEPLCGRLRAVVDFDRLNGGETRLSVVATDVVSGERVVFDTARGARIGPEHIVASGALLPLCAPVAVEGRLLGDGGLASNAPLDLVLDEPAPAADLLCFVVELFAREGSRPRSLAASAARAVDLAFGNQTRQLLEGRARERCLHALVGRLAARLPLELRADPEVASILAEATEESGAWAATVVCLDYRAGVDEAGPGKAFDFSRATLEDRWQAGARGMREALRRLESPAGAAALAPDLLLHEVAA